MLTIIVCIAPMCCIAQEKVFSNGKEIKGEYISIFQWIRSESGGVKIYYTYTPPGDTAGTWIANAGYSIKRLKRAMFDGLDQTSLSDSLGVILKLTADETTLFNAMSSGGYEFTKKEPQTQSWLGTTLLAITQYTFRRKAK